MNERGYILIQATLVLTVLMIMAAFALDLGLWYNTGSREQRAADLGALPAVSELTRVEATTGSRSAAELAGTSVAREIATQNGFDPADPDVSVGVTFSVNAFGGDEAQVEITETDLTTIFAGLVVDQVDASRTASAALNSCGAVCAPSVLIPPGITTLVNAGTGGDGYEPTVAGTKIFNIFHHISGPTLVCTDMVTESLCDVGGNVNYYPHEAYSGMVTNYTPKLAAINTKVYFIVQTSGSVGLGCWDGNFHSTCTGFSNPFPLASYSANSDRDGKSRIDGPEVVGSRLFMYGDDNRMYCYDTASAGACSGYPKNTALSGVHDATPSGGGGIAGGINTDGMQFDMELAPSGRIYLDLDPADGTSSVHCWDTNTNAACSGFGAVHTTGQRPYMFLTFDTGGNVNGVCAFAGKGGGKPATGHECWDQSGNSRGALMPWTFTKDTGEQPAHGVTAQGHTRTFFPFRKSSKAECWDWTTNSQCAIAASNWSSLKTEEYAYVSDGGSCIYALGHTGFLYSFSIDDGQYPCSAGGGVNTTIAPCTCADGTTRIWTTLVLTPDTNLSLFDEFRVTLTYPDGTVYFTGNLVGGSTTAIDLRPLNAGTPPAYMNLSLSGYVTAGQESVVFATGNKPGVALLPGVLPVLTQ